MEIWVLPECLLGIFRRRPPFRGSTNFDQRHNLVLLGSAGLPRPRRGSTAARLFADWRVSWLAAARSGFPMTVATFGALDAGGSRIINNRPDILHQDRIYSDVQ